MARPSCTPPSMPDSMNGVAVPLLSSCMSVLSFVRPSDSSNVTVLIPGLVAARQPFEDLGRDDPLVRDYLPELA